MFPSTISVQENVLGALEQTNDFSERRTAIKETEEGEGIQEEIENKWQTT
jgi:hypothetical protein